MNCSVSGCSEEAKYEVIFYDVYLDLPDVDVFYERHESCPYLCQQHLNENERELETDLDNRKCREYRGMLTYRHTQSHGQGFVIYRPL
jgi:hypothetical protein